MDWSAYDCRAVRGDHLKWRESLLYLQEDFARYLKKQGLNVSELKETISFTQRKESQDQS